MIKYIYFLLLISCVACNQAAETIDKAKELYAKRDSIDQMNIKTLAESGENLTKINVSVKDSLFELTADTQKDHRIIGYEKPDLKSTRLIIFSVFINDVENNPFKCELGAYYDLKTAKGIKIKYRGRKNDFVKATIKDSLGNKKTAYFEQKCVTFEEKEVEKEYPGQLKEHGYIEKIENFVYVSCCKTIDFIGEKINSVLENPKITTQLENVSKVIDTYKQKVLPAKDEKNPEEVPEKK